MGTIRKITSEKISPQFLATNGQNVKKFGSTPTKRLIMVQTPVSESFGSSPFPFFLLCVRAGKEDDKKQCQNDVSKEVQNIHTATDDSEKRVAIKTHGKQCVSALSQSEMKVLKMIVKLEERHYNHIKKIIIFPSISTLFIT